MSRLSLKAWQILQPIVAILKAHWHTLIPLAFIIAMLAGVAELSEDVMEGDTQSIDEKILLSLRDSTDLAQPLGPWWLNYIMHDLTALGSHGVLILVGMMSLGFSVVARRWDVFFFLLFSFVGALALNSGLKELFGRERPTIVPSLVDVMTYSYPSGHALLSSAIYLSFAAIVAELAVNHWARAYIVACALLLAGLVGISRIYLGVHYPSDVIAGWAIGSTWALLCWLATLYLKARTAKKTTGAL